MQNLTPQLEEYILQHQSQFYRLAFTYVKDPDAAMDVVQNAIVQALTHVHSLREPAYMQTWFYRILINEGLGYLRKHKRLLPMETPPEAFLFTGGDPGDDIARRLDVYRAVERLKPKLRTVVVLRFYEDMQLNEIAQITSTNINTVKSRLYKALEILRGEMQGGDLA